MQRTTNAPHIARPDHDRAALRHFHALNFEEQANAIRRLATMGMSDHGIAAATRLSVEFVRRILAEHAGK